MAEVVLSRPQIFFEATQGPFTIPAPDSGSTVAEYTVDFSNLVPNGAVFINGALKLGNNVYSMPYVAPSTGEPQTFFYRYNSSTKALSIRNKTSEWSNYYLYAIFFIP